MSRREGNIAIIENTDPDYCEDCGKVAELRPYGVNGANICFECGMKEPELTMKNCGELLFGIKTH